MKEKAFISVVTYVYNAEKTIENYIKELNRYLENHFENFEMILVNDAGTDNTIQEIAKIKGRTKGNISVVNLPWHHKPELAMLAGDDLAIGDFVYEIESTIRDYPIELIGQLFEKSTEGYDIVTACPSGKTSLYSRLFYSIFNKLSNIPLELKTERIRLISRRALNRILTSKEKIRYRKAFLRLSGFAFSDLYYNPDKNIEKIKAERSTSDKINNAFELLLVYTNLGTQICYYIAAMFLLLFVGFGMYAVFIFITLKTVAEGWTTLMLVLSAGFSGLFIVLGILSKYVSFIMAEVKEKPLYIVKSVDRITDDVQKIC